MHCRRLHRYSHTGIFRSLAQYWEETYTYIFRWGQKTIIKNVKKLWIGQKRAYNGTDAAQLGSIHMQQCTGSVSQNTETSGVNFVDTLRNGRWGKVYVKRDVK